MNSYLKIVLMLVVFVFLSMQMFDHSLSTLTNAQNIFRNIWIYTGTYLIILLVPIVLQILAYTVTWSWKKSTVSKFVSNTAESAIFLSVAYLIFQLVGWYGINSVQLAVKLYFL